MRACGGQLSGCLLTSRGVEIIDGDDEWSSCYVHLFPCVNVPCLNLAYMKCTKYLKCGMIDYFRSIFYYGLHNEMVVIFYIITPYTWCTILTWCKKLNN